MSCKLDNKEFKDLESKIGTTRAFEIYKANDDVLPNIQKDLGIEEGDVIESNSVDNLNKVLEFVNNTFDISFKVDFQEVGDFTIVKKISNDFTEKILHSTEDEFSPVEPDRTQSQYSSEESILGKTINSMSLHEIDVLNYERRERGLPAVTRDDLVKEPITPEIAKSRLDSELSEKAKYLEEKLDVKIRFINDASFIGQLDYGSGRPVITINKGAIKDDTLLHETIGHVYINAIGGLNDSRVSTLANRLVGEEASEEDKLEAVANVVGKKATLVFDDVVHQTSFQRFLDYLYKKFAKIFGKSTDVVEELATEGIIGYKNKGRNGFVPTWLQYQKMSNSEKLERKSNTRNSGHDAYVDFDEASHTYSVKGVSNTKSPSAFATGTDSVRAQPDYDRKTVTHAMLRDSKQYLPIAVSVAISKENTYRKLNYDKLSEDEREPINRFSITYTKGLSEKILDSADKLNHQYQVSAAFGTHLHDLADKFITSGFEINDPKYKKFYDHLKNLKATAEKHGYILIPEIRYFDKSTGFAGSSDLVMYNPKTDEQIMVDFKSKYTGLDEDGKVKKSRLTQFDRTKYLDFDIDLDATNIEDGEFALTSDIEVREEIHLTKEPNFTERDNIAAQQTGNMASEMLEGVDKATDMLQDILTQLETKIRADYRSHNKGFRDKWESVSKDIEEHGETDSLLGIVEYLKHIIGYVKRDEFGNESRILGEGKKFLDDLAEAVINSDTHPMGVSGWSKFQDRLDSLGLLSRVSTLLNSAEFREKLENIGVKDNLLSELNTMVYDLSRAKDQIKEFKISSSALMLTKLSTAHGTAAKENLRRQFVKENPPVSGGFKFGDKVVTKQEWVQAQEQYIHDNLKSRLSRAESEAYAFWYNTLKEGMFDISMLDKIVQDAGNTRSLLIQNVNKRLNQAETRYREDVLAKSVEHDKKLKGFAKQYGMSILDLNKVMVDLDEDGNPNGYMVSKFDTKIYVEYKKLLIDKVENPEDEDKAKAYSDFLEKYVENGEIKDKYMNPTYSKYKDMFDYLHELTDASDDALGTSPLGKYSKPLGGAVFYKLPQVRAEAAEHRMNFHFKRWGKEMLADMTFRRKAGEEDPESMPDSEKRGNNPKTADTEHHVNVKVNVKGEINREVPILFREDLAIDELSLDIASSVIKNYQMSVNYREKTAIQPELEMILDLVKETRPLIRKGIKQKLVNMYSKSGSPVRENRVSNEFEALESVIEHRLYGMNFQASSTLLGMDTVKMAKAANKLTANVMLIGNYISGGVNEMQGQYSNWINTIGNKNFTAKGLAKGNVDLWRDAAGWAADINSNVPTSETRTLVSILDIQGSFEYLSNPYIRRNLFTRIFNTDNSYVLHSAGEFAIVGGLMYGVLNSVKIKNANGEFLDKEGNVTTKDKAASLKDVTTAKDGKISYSVEFSHNTLSDIEAFSTAQLSGYMKSLAADLHGQYDHKMKAKFQRTAIGSMGGLMRRWIVRTTSKRFKGISNSFTDWDDLDILQKGYSEGALEFQEGYYASSVRYMSELVKSFKTDGSPQFAANWYRMSEQQRGGVVKTAVEAASIVALFMLANLVRALGDEEPDEKKKARILTMAYMIRRLYSEIGFFTNPYEFYKIIRSPMASMSLIETAGRALLQLSDVNEVYKRGSHKHENKLFVKSKKALPILKHLDSYELKGIEDKVKMQF